MPRPKSDDKRSAIVAAAIRVIVAHGLSGPTAEIAKQAGIPNGSLFTYFATKAALLNHLYLTLKAEMAGSALQGVNESAELRDQAWRLWKNWMNWAVAFPEKRKVLEQLSVSDQITADTRLAGHKAMDRIADLTQRVRDHGSMRRVPMGFVLELTNAVAETTMDHMVQNPASAKKYCRAGFEAVWRALG